MTEVSVVHKNTGTYLAEAEMSSVPREGDTVRIDELAYVVLYTEWSFLVDKRRYYVTCYVERA